jgi:hypothetical protein
MGSTAGWWDQSREWHARTIQPDEEGRDDAEGGAEAWGGVDGSMDRWVDESPY